MHAVRYLFDNFHDFFTLAAGRFSSRHISCGIRYAWTVANSSKNLTDQISFTGVMNVWFAPKQRSFAFGLLSIGTGIGSMLANFMSGLISDNYGWPYVFYICGLIGVISFAIFAPLVSSSPEKSRFVSEAELQQIQTGREICDFKKQSHAVPWKKIFMSKNVCAFCVYKLGVSFGLFVLQSKQPTYMSQILRMQPTRVSFD